MTTTKRKPKKKGFVSIGGFWKTQVMTAEGWRTVDSGTITPKGKRVTVLTLTDVRGWSP